MVHATYAAILRGLSATRTCARQCRQILERPPCLWNVDIPWISAFPGAHSFRFGYAYVFYRSGSVFRRKPWFWLCRFVPLFRDHYLIVVAQDVAGLRKRRCSQRRRQTNQHDHRGFALHRHRINPAYALSASWPLIQSLCADSPEQREKSYQICRSSHSVSKEPSRLRSPAISTDETQTKSLGELALRNRNRRLSSRG